MRLDSRYLSDNSGLFFIERQRVFACVARVLAYRPTHFWRKWCATIDALFGHSGYVYIFAIRSPIFWGVCFMNNLILVK